MEKRLTVAGELRLSREYHHCKCGTDFHPRELELELKLAEQGGVSDAMERHILDFGINDSFGSVAERWSIHYPTLISSNLERRLMDRSPAQPTGEQRREAAASSARSRFRFSTSLMRSTGE